MKSKKEGIDRRELYKGKPRYIYGTSVTEIGLNPKSNAKLEEVRKQANLNSWDEAIDKLVDCWKKFGSRAERDWSKASLITVETD